MVFIKKLYRLHVSCITSKEIRENADSLDNCLSNAEGTEARQIVESSEQPADHRNPLEKTPATFVVAHTKG